MNNFFEKYSFDLESGMCVVIGDQEKRLKVLNFLLQKSLDNFSSLYSPFSQFLTCSKLYFEDLEDVDNGYMSINIGTETIGYGSLLNLNPVFNLVKDKHLVLSSMIQNDSLELIDFIKDNIYSFSKLTPKDLPLIFEVNNSSIKVLKINQEILEGFSASNHQKLEVMKNKMIYTHYSL